MENGRFTFDGYDFLEWLKGNLKTIKEIAKVGIPLLLAWIATKNPALIGLFTLVGKFILDGLEYWAKKYEE